MRCRASGERLPLKRLANLSGCHFSDSCEIGQADHGDVIHTVCTIRKADLKSDAGVTWSLTASSRKSAATDCTIPDHQHAFPPFLCSRRHGPFEDGGHTTSTSRIDGRRSLHLRERQISSCTCTALGNTPLQIHLPGIPILPHLISGSRQRSHHPSPRRNATATHFSANASLSNGRDDDDDALLRCS